jgi:GT2 family glycosyltransferase
MTRSDTAAGVAAEPGARAAAVRIDPRKVPVTVAEVELGGRGVGGGPRVRRAAGVPGPLPAGEVLALVRSGGHPLGMVQAVLPADDPAGALLSAARAAYPDTADDTSGRRIPGRVESAAPALLSVVIATRERAGLLARCLDSVAALDHPRFEVVVVDNAPATDQTERLVKEHYADLVRYVREPVPGLAAAHNRGIAEALGEVIAFTDDDVVVDAGWASALAEPFAAGRDVACVTGLILPARLDTPAQATLEAHGGFAKGFAPRRCSLAEPPADDPLFPFTTGRLGSGANMAYRVDALRGIGGFDPATGTGTPARGGDDLIGFFRILAAGHTVAYQPEAIVWHHHRERPEDLDAQAYGYGAGLGAYLTAAVLREPRMLPALLRRLPGGVRYALARTATAEAATDDAAGDPHVWPARLTRLERRGLLYGPIGYLRSRRAVRGLPLPWEAPRHGN